MNGDSQTWFIFSVLYKSVVLHIIDKGLALKRRDEVIDNFTSGTLMSIAHYFLLHNMEPHIFYDAAIFFKRMFSILHPPDRMLSTVYLLMPLMLRLRNIFPKYLQTNLYLLMIRKYYCCNVL